MDPFAPLPDSPPPAARRPDAITWSTVLPVPADAPPPPAAHPKLGKPSATWTYRDADGGVLFFVLRFEGKRGDKQFRPLTFASPTTGGSPQWRWESVSGARPLYGLDRLADRPSVPVVVTEGEKAADAAAKLLPNHVAMTSPNGSKSAARADWTPLRGRTVVIWPDADEPGRNYATAVARLVSAAGAISVAVVDPPANAATGWDAADALAEGWTTERASDFIAAAGPFVTEPKKTIAPQAASRTTNGSATDGSGNGGKQPAQRDALIALTEFCELWHDAERLAFASFPVRGHVEHWPIRSRDFKMWLSGRFYEETGRAIGGQALDDGLRILEARAVNEGPEYKARIRVGSNGDHVWLDLCDDRWRAVEISEHGWSIIESPKIKFLRSPAMRALPEPIVGGMIEDLRRFFNVRSDADFMLTVAWIVAAIRDRGPYPILVANGEQGTGKSVFSRMVRSLVDPCAAPIRAAPKDDRDLIVSAVNSHVLAYDNLSSVPAWLSDGLCRMATGGGFATRMLHTDRDEMIFEAQKPTILNGIPSLTDRPDLADRALTVHLVAIPDTERRPEDELWLDFDAQRPAILGAILDAVVSALREMPTIKIAGFPRMADFVKWTTAAAPGLGWEPDDFMAAYSTNRRDVSDLSFEASPVAVAVRDFMLAEHPSAMWIGTPTELLAAITPHAPEAIRKSKMWPLTAQGLGNQFDRIAPLLRMRGFVIDRKHSGTRTIIITPPPLAS